MFNLRKTIVYCLALIFCLSLCFESYALTNLSLTGVNKATNTEYKQAPTGANFYSFKNKGDKGKIYTRIGESLDHSILRFYVINKDQKKNAKIIIYKYKNGKKNKWKTISIKKSFMQYKQFNTGYNSSSLVTYEIELDTGSNVDIAVTSFSKEDQEWGEHKKKQYDWFN